jgi:predicted short-subunit dehydrogenase-like oxidoreductase (DUF2520 family)
VENSLRAKDKFPVTIIGAGPVGSALALALREKKYPLRVVLSKKGKSAKALGQKIGVLHARLQSAKRLSVEGIFFIAVPDDEIKNVVQILSRQDEDFSRSTIFHTSGALSSKILSPLQRRGATVGSFHPVQTFPKSTVTSGLLKDVWIGIEGDKKAVAAAKHIVHDFAARSFVLSSQQKVLYHVAAVFSSNYFVTLLSVVEELGKRIHLPRRKMISIFEPLILQSLMNVKKFSAASALTGPIARGDVQTLKRHRAELEKKGLRHISQLYSALAKETSRLASRKVT